MTTNLRRNACPTLAKPMQTGDGLLARINTVTGAISPDHLALVAEAAARYGNGLIEITRRGSLQVRGLTAESATPFEREILDGGLDVRSGVPVETGPLAGLDVEEISDGRGVVSQLNEMISQTDLEERLGPKVSVVVDGGGRLPMADVLADLRLTAVQAGGVGWQVSVGGTARSARHLAVVDDGAAAAFVLALLTAIAARGRSGRGRDLTGAEISKVCGHFPTLVSAERSMVAREGATSPIGQFRLKRDQLAIGIGPAFGQMHASQLKALAQAAEKAEISEFRLAPGHALLAICGAAATGSAFAAAAARADFVVDPTDPRLNIVACAGAPACASGHMRTKEIAARIAARGLLPENGVVHVSGCAKRCAEPASPCVTILGGPQGVCILDGKTGEELGLVAEREVAAAFQRVMQARGMGRHTKSATTMRHRKSA